MNNAEFNKENHNTNENVIISEKSSKISIFTIIGMAVTAVLFVLAIRFLIGGDSQTGVFMAGTLIAAIITAVIHFATYGCVITVTNKRIYGKVAFGRRVDLPFDSVSAVTTTTVLTQGVSVSTSSGRITFLYLKQANQIAEEIRKLLVIRQDKNTAPTSNQQPASNADELKKYKELLENGIITQEEFDAKKKQLLGL